MRQLWDQDVDVYMYGPSIWAIEGVSRTRPRIGIKAHLDVRFTRLLCFVVERSDVRPVVIDVPTPRNFDVINGDTLETKARVL